MRRLLIIPAALAILAVPAATAAAKPSKADKQEAQRECRAERGTTDATREAFKPKYRNFGDCVSQKAREAKAERKEARTNASRECREERGDTEASREAFRAKYGTNENSERFGKCVSQKAKAQRAEQDAEDAEEAEERKNAAEECDAERGETPESRKAFADKYGTNGTSGTRSQVRVREGREETILTEVSPRSHGPRGDGARSLRTRRRDGRAPGQPLPHVTQHRLALALGFACAARRRGFGDAVLGVLGDDQCVDRGFHESLSRTGVTGLHDPPSARARAVGTLGVGFHTSGA